MVQALALTLGHNSSAILIEDGQIVAGYEQERLSKKKSDSSFPIDAIKEIQKRFELSKDIHVCVGHWFLDHQLPVESNKYWNKEFIKDLTNNEVLSIDREFTHHDSHLESGMVFAGKDFAPTYHALVVDGFGSSGECISLYAVNGKSYKLLDRWFGFEKSLGLLYQYATAFLNMQMNNHEYKMLAYEVHVHELDYDIDHLNYLVDMESDKQLKNMFKHNFNKLTDPMINLDALVNIQELHNQLFNYVLNEMEAGDSDDYDQKCIISYFVQRVLEKVILSLVKIYSPENILLVGGTFYNVKLNNLISKQIPGKTCIMPLAGDQGCGLGVYQRYFGDLKWSENLFFGLRDLDLKSKDSSLLILSKEEALNSIKEELSKIGFVNIVRGAMEFGPRALCNTSTLAIPSVSIAEKINLINGRTNEMPFALVVTQEQADKLFVRCDKIHKSLEYMVCTRDFQEGKELPYLGGAHYYPQENVYTCRPQITSDPFIVELLNTFGPLINTSFNYHGVPIVFDEEQIIYTHEKQQNIDSDLTFKTIIIKD